MIDDQLNPKVLGQLLLMQNIIINLPDRKSIFSFVCKGLLDIPGVMDVDYCEGGTEKSDVLTTSVNFPILMGGSLIGRLIINLCDQILYKPYEAYLSNFLFMIGIILEERKQRELNIQHQQLLEERILERTIELKDKTEEIEFQNEEYLQINEELQQINQELLVVKESAEESSETYRMLFESIDDAIFVSELDKRSNDRKFIRVNDVACKRLGYTKEELLNLSPSEINSENSKRNYASNVQKMIENKHGILELEHITKTGVVIPVEISTSITQFKNKIIFHSIARDITERKKIEQALEKNRIILNKSQEISKLGGWDWDLITNTIAWTDETFRIFNVNPYEYQLNIWDMKKFLNFNISQFEINGFKDFTGPGNPLEIQYRISLQDGSQKDLLRIGEVEFDKNEIPVRMHGIIQDITERKIGEIALVRAKERAEESDRLKTAILQNMSHEIRTPMNAIMGFSDLLVANFEDKEKLKKFSEIIGQRCNDLLEIINEILDFAKIESSQLSINLEECNLDDLFSELSAFFIEYRNRIGKQHIDFHLYALCDSSDRIIVSDKVKLKQIFINLISNAFKFTDIGKIEGGCRMDENKQLLFFVKDTGIGIPKEKQEVIFDRFTQLSQSSKRNIGGTGLGLAIVKGLVELLGGKMFLESEPNKGSTFSFVISKDNVLTVCSKSTSIEFPTEIDFKHKRILIVEDDAYNAEYLKEILCACKLDLLLAENGKDAVEIALTNHVDLVLMDIRLPDMNGYEITKQILPHKPNLKVIAQTAYAAYEESQKAFAAGCIDYISKPIKSALLLSLLIKYLE